MSYKIIFVLIVVLDCKLKQMNVKTIFFTKTSIARFILIFQKFISTSNSINIVNFEKSFTKSNNFLEYNSKFLRISLSRLNSFKSTQIITFLLMTKLKLSLFCTLMIYSLWVSTKSSLLKSSLSLTNVLKWSI